MIASLPVLRRERAGLRLRSLHASVALTLGFALAVSGCSSSGPSRGRIDGGEEDSGAPSDLGTTPRDSAPPPPRYEEIVLDGLPDTLIDMAIDADENTSLAASFVYPETGTVIPPNLGGVSLVWEPAAGTDRYVLRFRAGVHEVAVVTTGTTLALSPEDWATLVMTLGGGEVTITLYAFSSTDPTKAGQATHTLTFSRTDLMGAVYFWASRGNHSAWVPGEDATEPRGYFRYDFTDGTAEEASLFMGFDRGEGCVGCHSLSAEGTRFSTSFGGDLYVGVVDVASNDNPATFVNGGRTGGPDNGMGGHFSAFSPDATRLFATGGSELRAYDVSAGGEVLLETRTTAFPATHVAVSPMDGAQLLYVEDLEGSGGTRTRRGRIMSVRWLEATDEFSAPEVFLEEAGHSLYYPTISPDGQWVLYDRVAVVSGDGFSSLSHPNAAIWAHRLDGTGTPRELVSANRGAGLSNSWPRWAPFPVQVGGSNPVYHFTYSSMRTLVGSADERPQLWLATFDPAAPANEDPSTPGLWIPIQSEELNNHSAQWTEVFVDFE